MTKDQRKQYVSDNFTFLAISDALSLIDQVYNDVAPLEKHIKELEAPKTCEGCMYVSNCFIIDSLNARMDTAGFSCNRHVSKETT